MPEYTEVTNIGQIIEEHPEASDLFSFAGRVQLDRFRDHAMYVAAPYMGLTKEKMQALLNELNSL